MSTKQPWMKFHPQDWRADEKLRMCSLAARGLWIEMLAIMHRSERYGQLLIGGRVPTDAQLAVQVGASPSEVTALLAELDGAGVFSRAASGAIYSRRMTRDHKKAEDSRKNGKKGGNPALLPSDGKEKEKTGWDKGRDKSQDKARDKAKKSEARDQSKPPNPLAGDLADPAKAFWDEAKAYLGTNRSGQIARWVKDHGVPAVQSALTLAKAENGGAGANDPMAFMAVVLRNGAERLAAQRKVQDEQDRLFNLRFPPRQYTEAEASAMMEPEEFARWKAGRLNA